MTLSRAIIQHDVRFDKKINFLLHSLSDMIKFLSFFYIWGIGWNIRRHAY